MDRHSEIRLTAIATLEAGLRRADPSDLHALLDETWTAEDIGVLVSTLMFLFTQLADETPDRARALLQTYRQSWLDQSER